jgi:hypothetical protein
VVRVIGNADEFWRLRLTRVDTTRGLEFEWHDDILYREPDVDHGDEVQYWHVEAVRMDDADTVVRLRTFASETAAREFLSVAQEDLTDLTKSRFELAYFDAHVPDAPQEAE